MTTVKELFLQVGITQCDTVKWDATCPETRAGLYIVSLCADPAATTGLKQPVFDDGQIQTWIDRLPDFRLDGAKPTLDSLKKRLSDFWQPNENVLYIGQTGSALDKRIRAYYRTPLGDRKPHSGGQWLKTLRILPDLYVHYAASPAPEADEATLLTYFKSRAGELPFANLTGPDGRKQHGMVKQREEREK